MFKSLFEALTYWRVWFLAAIYKVVLGYRRTWMGTFWLMITMVLVVAVKGLLLGDVMNVPSTRYLPSLAMGMALWGLISGLMTGGASAFIGYRSIITQSRYPLFVPVLANMTACLFTFTHHLIAMFCVVLLFVQPNWIDIPLGFAAIALMLINGVGIGYLLAHICTRYRDIDSLVKSVMAVLFILTPVLWVPEQLGEGPKKLIMECNPFYHMLETLRDPFVGQPIEWINWAVSGGIAVVSWSACWVIYRISKRKILLWV